MGCRLFGPPTGRALAGGRVAQKESGDGWMDRGRDGGKGEWREGGRE